MDVVEIELFNEENSGNKRFNFPPESLKFYLGRFVLHYSLEPQKVAEKLGWSTSVWNRLISGKTCPTEKAMNECLLMFCIGFEKYSRLSKKEVDDITEKMGAVTAAGFGAVAVKAIVSSVGVASGLSAAGIMSGLRVLGSFVGGGAAAGISVAASIPVAAGLAGWGIIKIIKWHFSKIDRFKNKLDLRFEREW